MRKIRWDIICAVALSAAIAVTLSIPARAGFGFSPDQVSSLFVLVEDDFRNPLLSSPAAISVLNGATKGIAQFAGYDEFQTRLNENGEIHLVSVVRYAGDLPGMLNAEALLKQTTPGREPVIYLGEIFWQRVFGGKAEIIGSSLELHQTVYRIAGVIRERSGLLRETDLWIPMRSRGPLSQMSSMKIVGKLQLGSDFKGVNGLIARAFRQFLPEQHFGRDGNSACLMPLTDASSFDESATPLVRYLRAERAWSDS